MVAAGRWLGVIVADRADARPLDRWRAPPAVDARQDRRARRRARASPRASSERARELAGPHRPGPRDPRRRRPAAVRRVDGAVGPDGPGAARAPALRAGDPGRAGRAAQAVQRPLRRARPSRPARRCRRRSRRLASTRHPELEVVLGGAGVDVPAASSSRSPSRCSSRRCATRGSTRRRRRVEVHVGARRRRASCSRSPTTASRDAHGGRRGMGLRLAALEALQHGGVVEFGAAARTAGGCGCWSPMAAEPAGPAGRAAPGRCGCWSSTTTTSSTGASG